MPTLSYASSGSTSDARLPRVSGARALAANALSLACLVGVLARSTSAHALDAAACVAQHERGQQLVIDGELLEARTTFATCVDESCPSLVRSDCVRRYDEVVKRIPSVTLRARTPSGEDVLDVKVWVDGRPRADLVAGKALELDPGTHRVRMESVDGHVEEFDLVAHEGETLRPVVRIFDAPGVAPAPPRASAPVPLGVYLLGATAALGFGSFGFFGLRGLGTYDDLSSRCAPGCSEADVRGVRNELLVADISLGVGVVAAALATWLFLDSRNPAPPRAE